MALRRKAFACALLGAFLPIAGHADLTITQQVQQEGPPIEANVTMTMKMKEGKMRLDLNPQASSIVDLETGEMISLIHPQKLAMPIPGASLKGIHETLKQEALKSLGSDATPPVPTGRKETISGYACEEFETRAKGKEIRLWLTRDLPAGEKLLSELSALAGLDPFRGLTKDKLLPGFPIRTVIQGNGIGKTTVTVLEINESPIADSEFVVPEDYWSLQLPGIPGE